MSVLILLALLTAAACNGNGPQPASTPLYILDSEAVDPATGALTVNIRVPSTATRDWVKTAVQEVVDNRKQQHKVIWVRTYIQGPNDRAPYATSHYDGGAVTHEFVGGSEQKKIPTH
jgi:hypothetical protein